MARNTRDDELRNRCVEDAGLMIGDAKDFLDREESILFDMLDKLEDGRLTFIAARLAVRLDFAAGHKDIDDWQKRWAGDAEEAGYPYLHPSFRIVAPLPRVIA